MSQEQALVRLEEVRMHFRARGRGLFGSVVVKALDGVSLALGRGETLAVVGESGSGKTTLGRVSLRLLEPTAGRVLFDGQDVTHAPEGRLKEFRRRAQGIFQDPFTSLDPYMTIRQTVEEPLVIHGMGSAAERLERVTWALDEVRLRPAAEFLDRYPHMLSGGQRQRAGIARALTLTPEYVLADEPVSMIDASSRAEVLALLRDLQERHGIAYLYITHDIATARHFAPRTAVMYLGRIVEEGPTRDVINEPLHPYTKGLLAAVPEPDPANRLRERAVLPGEPPSPADIPSGCRFHPRCPFFMAGLCDVVDPPAVEATPRRTVACHLYSTPQRPATASGAESLDSRA
jgi:peptide/nickel transport system ATP-binding protein